MKIRLQPLEENLNPLDEAIKNLKQTKQELSNLKKSNHVINDEEINQLKQKNRILIEERDMLKVALTHTTSNTNKKPPNPRNKQIQNSIKQQISLLEDLISKKEKEYDSVTESDTAYQISEQQEEIKVNHLELIRLANYKSELNDEITKSERKCNELINKYNEKVYKKKYSQISNLEKEIIKQEQINNEIRHNIEMIKERLNSDEEKSKNKQLSDKINKLKTEIAKETQHIAELERNISNERSNYLQNLFQ